ncbi:hypothetical protein ACLOJK_008767 [Asimina triloba]
MIDHRMAAPKPEEIPPPPPPTHPPMDQLQGFEYCIDSNPSWGEAIALEISSKHESNTRGSDRLIQSADYLGIQPDMGDLFKAGRCVEIGVPMLILFIAFSQCPEIGVIASYRISTMLTMWCYLKHFQAKQLPILERFALLISITVIWAYAHLLTASGAYKHRPETTQWGAPTFDAGHSFGMMAAVLVSLVESTGAYKAASRLASATPPPAHVLSRGIGWQGVGILLDGLFGTVTGSTVSVENVGLLGSTRVGSRRVIQISAAFMIGFSLLGKFGALFASIPFTIFAAVYCVLFGLVGRHLFLSPAYYAICMGLAGKIQTLMAAVGLSFLQFTNMNSMRNLFIVGVSLFLGLSFNDFINTFFFSPPTVALIVAVFLDNTLDYKDAAAERGMPWWSKFRTFKGDSRNEEFYTLPFNLNRFFPPS